MRLPTHTKTTRRVETRDFTRAWQEGVRVFGIDTAFYRMAFNHNFVLLDGQRLTRCDAQLLFDQVNAGDHFGYRVFNLNTGVHLNEVELAVFEQELESTRPAIADINTGFGATLADVATQFRSNARCWCFFDNFLVTTLHGAVALTQPDGIAITISQYLNFDMAWILEVLFRVDLGIIERSGGFGFGRGNGRQQSGFGVDHAHAATTTTARGLD